MTDQGPIRVCFGMGCGLPTPLNKVNSGALTRSVSRLTVDQLLAVGIARDTEVVL